MTYARALAGLSRGRALAILTGLWLALGLLAGTLEHLAVRGPRGGGWHDSLAGPLAAGAIWVPLTMGIVAVARRWPLLPRPGKRVVALHLGASVAVSFLLNLLWSGVFALTGDLVPGEALEQAWRAGLRFLHLNAGVYWAIVLLIGARSRLAGKGARSGDRSPIARGSGARGRGSRTAPESLEVRIGARTRLVRVASIDWIEGAGDYARLHAGGRAYLVSERLKDLEVRLEPAGFARIHRSTIVNLLRIRELEHRSHGDYDAVLDDGTELRVSRSHRRALRRRLDSLRRGRVAGDRPPRPVQ